MDWIQKYKAVIDMNEERITFRVEGRKFTIKLVLDTKPQNKVHYYIISKSEDIIDLTLTEDDTEALKGDDESHLITIESEEESTSSDKDATLILNQLKGQFLDDAIASYKAKC